jgi:hypothetical protein
VFSNVPAAILLSDFTDNVKALLVGVNLGGLGTLIASMASLISFKLVQKENIKASKYILVFTLVNIAFLGANLRKGIEYILEKTDFTEKIQNADLIITGEGKLDIQSLMGKVPFFVAEKSKGKRVLALVGVSEVTTEEAQKNGISEIVETNPLHLPFETIKTSAKQMLIEASKNILI